LITFQAPWLYQIGDAGSETSDFNSLSGQNTELPAMYQVVSSAYKGAGYQAIEIRCGGAALSMVILLPDVGQYRSFESRLDGQTIGEVIAGLSAYDATVSMPTWKSNTPRGSLKQILIDMGMTDAFDDNADFSGMSDAYRRPISNLFHRASVQVDQTRVLLTAGTNQMSDINNFTNATIPRIRIDRPFIYLLRDIDTGLVLFFGRVVDPSANSETTQ
jgi:serpin B